MPLKFDKKVLMSIDGVYTVNAFRLGSGMVVAAGPEKEGDCRLYDMASETVIGLGHGAGGVMSIVPFPGRDDLLFSVQGLFPPFKGLDAGLFRHVKSGDTWLAEKMADLPFAHRCEVLASSDGTPYLAASTVSRHKDCPEDWSEPGCVYACPLDGSGEYGFTAILDGLYRNHGMTKFVCSGRESVGVSSDEGIFVISIDGAAVRTEGIFCGRVSEFAFADLDGDGEAELVTIEPFHGERLCFYKKSRGSYVRIAEDALSFGHGLSAGTISGRSCVAVGNRMGGGELCLYSFGEGTSLCKDVLERSCGPTQTQFFNYGGKDRLLAALGLKGEVAVYTQQ